MTTRKNNKPIKANKRKTGAKRKTAAKRKTVAKRKTNNKRNTRKQRGGEGVKDILDASTTVFLQHNPPSIKRDWINNNHLVQFPINNEYLSNWRPLAEDVNDEYSDCVANSVTFLRVIPKDIGKKLSKYLNTNSCGIDMNGIISIYKKAYPNDTFAGGFSPKSLVKNALRIGHAALITVSYMNSQNTPDKTDEFESKIIEGHSVIVAKDLEGKTWIIDSQRLTKDRYDEYFKDGKYDPNKVGAIAVTTTYAKSEIKRDIDTALSNTDSDRESIEPLKKRARIINGVPMDIESPQSQTSKKQTYVPMDIESPRSQTPNEQTYVPMEID